MSDIKHSETAQLRGAIGTVVTAVLGFIVAAVSLLVFVFDLLVTPEMGALIVSFVVCGIGLTTGFIVLRRLVPGREPTSLFGGSGGVPLHSATLTPLPARRNESPPEVIIKSASRVHRDAEVPPVMKSHGIAAYNTHDDTSVAALATAVGMTAILVGRLAFAWQFLSLALLAGGAVALFLYWSRNWKQGLGISGYKIPVAGGVVGLICMAGIGTVMLRFHFLRDFLGLAILAGGAIALGLNWSRRRTENSGSSFV